MTSSSNSESLMEGQGEKPKHVLAAAKAVGRALGTRVYAVVGGAACSLLGSVRATDDVDIVVPKGMTREARQLLRNNADLFEVDGRTLHTYFKSDPPIEIEILAPPALFREEFDQNTPVIEVDGVKILKPSLILNAKCNSILSRGSENKKITDSEDLKFCLRWCATNESPSAAEVPRATKDFVKWFIGKYGEHDLWADAGVILIAQCGGLDTKERTVWSGLLNWDRSEPDR